MMNAFHNVRLGCQRLLSAPRDLPWAIKWVDPPLGKGAAHVRHRELFDEYVSNLEWAVDIALRWWYELVRNTMGTERDTQESAMRANYVLRPAGPASRPEVIYVIRHFWLECSALNQVMEEGRPVPPEVLLLAWLMDGRHDRLVSVLSGMPYWPIGVSGVGTWV